MRLLQKALLIFYYKKLSVIKTVSRNTFSVSLFTMKEKDVLFRSNIYGP